MINKFFIFVALVFSIFWVSTVVPIVHAEDPYATVCNTTDPKILDSAVCKTPKNPDPIKDSNGIVTLIANIVASVGGLIAIIMIIFNSAQLILSSGKTEKVVQARNGIIYAAIGIVVLVMARTIVYFILSKL